MISIGELLKQAAGMLRESNISDTPILDAELIMIYVLNLSDLGFDRLKLLTQPEYKVDEHTAQSYLGLIEERSKGKPVQYLTNEQEFMGVEFYVTEGVLIPRADTEIVVEKVIELAKDIVQPYIIDMCTGSGAIAVSLALNLHDARVWAVDISDYAISCCSINVARCGLQDAVSIVKSDLFNNIQAAKFQEAFDIIVSNPPYIESGVIGELGINVRNYEPHLALDGGEDGLVYYRRIIRDCAGLLKNNGILAFEVGHNQGVKVKKLMEESGYYADLNIEKDLAGFDRCVWGRKK